MEAAGTAIQVGPASAPVRDPVLSIVLATINERWNLPKLLERIDRQSLPPYEVVVVDDGSIDGTRELLVQLAQRDPRIRPMFHDGPQTLIPAHSQGIEAARGRFIVVMDADLQHPPETIPSLVSDLQDGAGLCVATRYAKGGSRDDSPPLRMAISAGALFAAKLLVPHAQRTSDPMSGFYGFQRSVFVPVDPRWRGYELLPFVLAMCRDLSVTEVPYAFVPRSAGLSKIVGWDLHFIRIYLVQLVLAARFDRLLGHRTTFRSSKAGTEPEPARPTPMGAPVATSLLRR